MRNRLQLRPNFNAEPLKTYLFSNLFRMARILTTNFFPVNLNREVLSQKCEFRGPIGNNLSWAKEWPSDCTQILYVCQPSEQQWSEPLPGHHLHTWNWQKKLKYSEKQNGRIPIEDFPGSSLKTCHAVISYHSQIQNELLSLLSGCRQTTNLPTGSSWTQTIDTSISNELLLFLLAFQVW